MDDGTFTYAGFTKRVAASALDFILIAGYLAALLGAGLALQRTGLWKPAAPPSLAFLDLFAFLTAVLPVILYFTLQESAPAQATWGKRRLGLRVVGVGGGRLSRERAFARSLAKFLPWQLAHTSLFHIPGWPFAPESPPPLAMAGLILAQVLVLVYLGSLALGRAHRTPYDWVSGACVVVGG